MTISTITRAFSVSFVFGSLSACGSTGVPVTTGPDAKGYPVSAAQLLSSFTAANPGQTSVQLLDARGRGFIIHNDNTIMHRSIRSLGEVVYMTAVASSAANEICMERSRNWSGACLELYQMYDGSVRVIYTFGNGHGGMLNRVS